MSTRDRNQWIAIGILTTAVICLLVLFVLNPTKPQSPVDLQPIFPTPTGQAISTEVTAGPQIIICPTEMYGTETTIMGQQVICGNAASATESIATQTAVFTSTPIVAIPATTTPIHSNVVECYFAGARLPDGHVPSADRIGYAGRCEFNALTGQVSLQPFWEEVVNYDTNLPAGLSVNDVEKQTFEPINDGVRVIAIKRNGVMYFFVADSVESQTTLPFWTNSCVSYDLTTNIVTFYHDDDSKGPGGFDGSCTGVFKSYDGKDASTFSGENLFYIKAIQSLEQNGYTVPDKPFVIDVLWFEKWPQ